MKQLVEVIKIIAEKYINDVNLIISKDKLILEYLTIKNDEIDIYKTIEIKEFEDKLKIKLLPEKIIKIIAVADIEDILLTLEKQTKTELHSKSEIDYIKNKYKVGMQIELVKMYDLINEVPPRTKGTIYSVDDIGTLHVDWENGTTAGIVVGTDEFKILNETEKK